MEYTSSSDGLGIQMKYVKKTDSLFSFAGGFSAKAEQIIFSQQIKKLFRPVAGKIRSSLVARQ